MNIRAIIVGLCLLMAASVWAQQGRGAGNVVTRTPSGETLKLYESSWAVVIGINEYQKWPSLQYAVNDAEAVRDRLIALGFPEENITFLTDGKATKETIERVLGDRLRRKVGKDDRVFIYFAGHGQTEDLPGGRQEGYIVPMDGDRSDLFSTCVSMTTVRQFSERLAAKHVFYAIDACYSGLALVRAGELDSKDRQYLRKVAQYPSRQLVTAGSAGEQVIERGGHGAFTNALLIAMGGSADRFPPFGVLTGSELGNYLKPVVSVETNNAQTPQFGRLSAGEGEFMFVLPELGGGAPPAQPPPTGTAARPGGGISPVSGRIAKLQAQVEADRAELDALRKKAASQSWVGGLFSSAEEEQKTLEGRIAAAEGELAELQEREFSYAKEVLARDPGKGRTLLEAFVNRYPNAELADDALWALIGAADPKAAENYFLRLQSFYPESPYIGQYEQTLKQRRAAQKVQEGRTALARNAFAEAMQAFRAALDIADIGEARNLLKAAEARKAEYEAFAEAKRKGTGAALKGFLGQYPSGTYAQGA